MSSNSPHEIELDEKPLETMKIKIIDCIKQNSITKEKNHSQMVDVIREIITTESNKNY